MRVLVTGGAGYVGSHAVLSLRAAGHDVTVFDNLSAGHREAVVDARLVVVDLTDRRGLARALEEHGPFDAVMHFAALTQVGESMRKPLGYYRANVTGACNLVEGVLGQGTRWFVFSSSAAVYGEPESTPLVEAHPLAPSNPYGETKRAVEAMLHWAGQASGLRYVSLRYFNAAGADPGGRTGERHDPETHLIPSILHAALGRRPFFELYGTDWPTPDGSCIRDFVHVSDLAEAHRLALEYLRSGGPSAAFNLGSGTGYSVRQVLDVCRRVSGAQFEVREGPRRPGDPAVLVASSDKAREVLGWRPALSSLELMVQSAWRWHVRGY